MAKHMDLGKKNPAEYLLINLYEEHVVLSSQCDGGPDKAIREGTAQCEGTVHHDEEVSHWRTRWLVTCPNRKHRGANADAQLTSPLD